MTETVKNKKKEFGELIHKLESNDCHFGSYIIEDVDIISSIGHHFEYNYDVIDYNLLMKFLNDKKEEISYLVNKNFGYYESDILEGIDEDIWDEFGDEILKVCNLNSGTVDK
jgi:hypothetical protein